MSALSRFHTVLNYFDNFYPKYNIPAKGHYQEKHALQCQLQDGGTETM